MGVNMVKLVVERYLKFHDIDLKLLATYQQIKHAQIKPIQPPNKKNSHVTVKEDETFSKQEGEEQKKEENKNELPAIDKTKKKALKKFLVHNVEVSIRFKRRDILEYFCSVYDFQFLSEYSPLGVCNSIHLVT
jgi:hypothetical protein